MTEEFDKPEHTKEYEASIADTIDYIVTYGSSEEKRQFLKGAAELLQRASITEGRRQGKDELNKLFMQTCVTIEKEITHQSMDYRRGFELLKTLITGE